MDIHKNTSLNIDLSNIVFHYSKELLFKNELKEVMNDFNGIFYINDFNGIFYIYHIRGKWIKINGSLKYIDYGLNRKYKSYRKYVTHLKESLWDEKWYSEREL
jgi:hypothetical protein